LYKPYSPVQCQLYFNVCCVPLFSKINDNEDDDDDDDDDDDVGISTKTDLCSNECSTLIASLSVYQFYVPFPF